MSVETPAERTKDSLIATILILFVVVGTLLAIIAGYAIWRGNEGIRLLSAPATQNALLETLSEQASGIAVANLPPEKSSDATFSADIREHPRIVAGWSEGTNNDAAADIDAALTTLNIPTLVCPQAEPGTLT